MLEDQRNEYASGLVAFGNHAENLLQEKHAEYSEEISRLKHQAEAYIGNEGEDITSRSCRELIMNSRSSVEMPVIDIWKQKEKRCIEMSISVMTELLMAKSRSMHQESELTSLQRSHQDRSAIYILEIPNL